MYSYKTRQLKSPSGLLKRGVANLVHKAGLVRLGRPFWANWLTVVNYHRIDDADRPGFDSFKPNVSAVPEEFDRQMAYLAKWFNVISVEKVSEYIAGKSDLPPYAALITFDDGYLDNYTKAYPILRRYNFPALIFLTTDHIGTDAPFYWDMAAYCFHHTGKDNILFPDGHVSHWSQADERNPISDEWIAAMKVLPEIEKKSWIERLPGILGVSIPDGYFRGLMMDWDNVREMSINKIAFGGHTLNHPILTRISTEEAKLQVEGSKWRIEEETAKQVLGFAYPNGQAADLDRNIERLVADAGYRLAFTLSNGPSSWGEVKANPFTIRRIFISHKHSLARYTTMLSPLNRLRG